MWFAHRIILTLTIGLLGSRLHADSEPTFHGKTLKQWVADLDHRDGRQRCRAATALGLGPFGARAVPPLLMALSTKDAKLRRHVIVALGNLGPEAKIALPHLVRLLEQKPGVEELGLIWGTMSNLGPVALPAFLAQTSKGLYPGTLPYYLVPMGAAVVPVVVKALEQVGAELKLELLGTLARLGSDAVPAVPTLLELLRKERDPELRQHLIMALGWIGGRSETVVNALVDRLSHETEREVAVRALLTIGPPAWPALRRVIDRGPPAARAAVFTHFDGDFPDGVALCLTWLEDAHQATSAAAGFALRAHFQDLTDEQPAILEAAKKARPEARVALFLSLGRVPILSDETSFLLARSLHDADRTVRDVIALTLQSRTLSDAAVGQVIAALRDRSEDTRCKAIELLGKVVSPSEAVLFALCESLRDGDPAVRASAALAIAKHGGIVRRVQSQGYDTRMDVAVPLLQRLLHDRNGDVRVCAATALCRIGCPSELAIREVARGIADPPEGHGHAHSFERWRQSVAALEASGPTGAAALPLLVQGLKHPEARIRSDSLDGLRRLGPLVRPALSSVIPFLGEPARIAETAVKVLQNAGDEGAIELVRVLEGSAEKAQRAVCDCVQDRTPGSDRLIPPLLRLVRASAVLRTNALSTLRALAVRGESYRRTLLALLDDDAEYIRGLACVELGRLGLEASASLPELRDLLLDRSANVRREALCALAGIDAKGKTVVPDIAEMLTDPDASVRDAAVRVLGKFGQTAHPVVGQLRTRLQDREPHVRVEAALALWRITGEKSEPLRILREVHRAGKRASDLAGKVSYLFLTSHVQALQTMRQIEKTREPLELLVRLLEDRDRDTRLAAVSALVGMGEEAKEVLPAVQALLKHRTPSIRRAARDVHEALTREKPRR